MARRRRATTTNEAEQAAAAAASPTKGAESSAPVTPDDPFASMNNGTSPDPFDAVSTAPAASALDVTQGLDALTPDAGKATIQQAVQEQHHIGDPAFVATLNTALGEISKLHKAVADLEAKVSQAQQAQTQTIKLVQELNKNISMSTSGIIQEIRDAVQELKAGGGVTTATVVPPSQTQTPPPAATPSPTNKASALGTEQQQAICAPIVAALTERYKDPAFPSPLSMADSKHRVAICQAAKANFPALDVGNAGHQQMVEDALKACGYLNDQKQVVFA